MIKAYKYYKNKTSRDIKKYTYIYPNIGINFIIYLDNFIMILMLIYKIYE